MCACKHCTAKLSLYYIEHIKVADEFNTLKNLDLTQLFLNKARNVGRLK